MNHRVPAHEPEDDPNARRKLPDDELFELIWRNGPVLQQLAGDRTRGWSPPDMGAAAAPSAVEAKELFIEEDEMALWLHYDIGGGDIYGDLLESSAPASVSASHESPVVESNESQAKMLPEARTCERAVTSPSGERANPPPEEARKRKMREDVDSEYDHSEEAEFRSGDKRKGACQSALPKRTRAAEVHNLSERRRRDKINEKMKALQELIPRCNKSDKASMLDEAIEYLKSLQLQVQMMSMGCNMGPMMFPGVQTYLPSMGMGMVMGMPMGRDMHPNGLGHPMLQYGSLLPCHPMVGPSRPAHLLPRPVMPAFHPPSIAVQASNLQDPVSNSIGMLGPNNAQIPNIVDQYHRYPGVHQLRNQE